MKVLLVTGIYPPDIGGPATYVPQLASKLTQLGHSPSVVTLRDRKSVKFEKRWQVKYLNRKSFFLFRFLKTIILVISQLRNSKVVFANGLHEETGVALAIIKKPGVAKIVGDPVWERAINVGGTQLGIIEFNKSKLSKMQAMQRKFLVWSLNRFTHITCPSKELCELVISWGVRTPVIWIANGTEVSDLNSEEKIYDLVSVSRLVKWKNTDLLIQALQGTPYSLAIVGNGPELSSLKALSAHNHNIHFLGHLPSQSVNNVLSKSKAFVLISDYEGLSFSLLQAMERSLPVIVSNIRGNTDVVIDGREGYVVDQNSQKDVLNAIEELLQNDKESAEKGITARKKIILSFNQENQLKKMCDLVISSSIGIR